MTICFKHMEYLHFFINSCVPSLFYTVRIVLVMQSDNVFIILKHACEQATFWSQKVEFQNVLMSMLISIPATYPPALPRSRDRYRRPKASYM